MATKLIDSVLAKATDQDDMYIHYCTCAADNTLVIIQSGLQAPHSFRLLASQCRLIQFIISYYVMPTGPTCTLADLNTCTSFLARQSQCTL